jgi:DNA integrity scanning protein DisA with diadenylate cyclase activity
LQNATFVAEEDLADAADLAARLSAVDGALVVRSDLSVIGFGAEIVLDAAVPITAFEVTGHPLRAGDWPAVDSESFGMRHRSALRCIATADGAAAFVVSQDGTVTFMWKQDGRLLLKRNVNTANPNMVGA